MSDVDAVAQIIRRVDGDHTMGAGALAEAILPEVTKLIADRIADRLDEQAREAARADKGMGLGKTYRATLRLSAESIRREYGGKT